MDLDFSSSKGQREATSSRCGSFVAAALGLCSLTAAAGGCAEVTQDLPESQLGMPSGGGNATGSAGAGGVGAGGSVSGPGQGGSLGNSGGAIGSGAQGGSGQSTAGSGAQGGSQATAGSAGTSGAGGNAPEPGPQFPAGTELMSEDFESDDLSRWAISSGTWARTLDAETGSNVFAQSDTGPSVALLAAAGDATWRDVRVEADFKVLAFNGSSSSYLAGLCVRLTNDENFYLVGLRSDSDQHIGIRKFGSSNTNLSQSEAFSGTENVWYHLRVDAIGDTLSVYVDDELVLEQSDAEHVAGGIGLCTVRASALFDNVLVTAP